MPTKKKAAAVSSRKGPVGRAVRAIDIGKRERDLIEATVGKCVRVLMDPDVKEPPDLAAIYKKLGGKTEFTSRLLAETFGSKALRKKGTYPLRANTAPDLAKMTTALEDMAIQLTQKKVPGLRGRPVRNAEEKREPGVLWVFESSPRFRVKCEVSSNGGGSSCW